jgi:hypothetical protein
VTTPTLQAPFTRREIASALGRALKAGLFTVWMSAFLWLVINRDDPSFMSGTAWLRHSGSSLAASGGGVMARMLIADYSKKYEFGGLLSKIAFQLFFVGSIWVALELWYQVFNPPTEYQFLPIFMLLLAVSLAFHFGKLRPLPLAQLHLPQS